ncbi:RiPP maturation radical SAM C-methyltransferase [Croceicoccus marinus]|jgi:ribosomal peptide maturation radical SAM protein 1|uniref:RiPP maturation radical SAM protein 1 n=1 Tax=Croceicoccus marinus TaxID=450378 RepID=A0A7G6VSM0_9SPHN|nr:RiPP maturation radical SAM C-methyltransferase [Croceicoccus marinus]QNE04735.1 RiPP maturation radical SAM protein 1 [Croceicoccus marinus]
MRKSGIHRAGTARQESTDVVLVNMPWATTTRPSIALGILDRICNEAEVSSRSLFPHLDLVARLGFDASRNMSDERALYGLGEHLFAVDLFGKDALASDLFLELICGLPLPAPFSDLDWVMKLRDETIPKFLDDTLTRILACEPLVLGVTATFNQVMASLAIARRVKQARLDCKVIAGGACFDGEMGQEYHRALPGILDHVFMGEAEDSFREFLRRLKAGEHFAGIRGVTWEEDGAIRLEKGTPLRNMDASPMPNYDPFFAETARVRDETGMIFNVEALPVEGSRGCWWGQKNHCVFCGINEELLTFREKSPDRVVGEMLTLSNRHNVAKLTATDWIISRKSRNRIFAGLRDADLDLEVFYETRSDLAKEEVELMRRAGATRVQPGIESFSTPLLKLMRKGTSGIRQVRFLRWCREYGVKLSYNILCGFPGDDTSWYVEMIDLIAKIPHLQPPTNNANFLELHRFSPLFDAREQFGISSYELRVDYMFNFPEGLVDPLKVGYFFEYKCDTMSDPGEYMPQLRDVIRPWLEAWDAQKLPRYDYTLGPGFVSVVDFRPGRERQVMLTGIAHDVFLLCDDIQTLERLSKDLFKRHPEECAGDGLAKVIDDLVARDILLQEGSQLLALPIATNPRSTERLREVALGPSDPQATISAVA